MSASAFVVLALVALALGGYVLLGELRSVRSRQRRRPRPARRPRRFDPGVERRAELKARALLRSIVNPEEWEMYRDLGFIRVIGRGPARGIEGCGRRNGRTSADPSAGLPDPSADPSAGLPDRTSADPSAGLPADGFSFLIYPHKPIVAYLPGSNSLLSEYCVEFPDRTERLYGPKLPDSDDVLAKWLLIRADEEALLRGANMHLPGRQVDPQRVRRDLWRLAEWERARSARRSAPEASAA